MSDIVLIQPPIRDFYLTRKRTYPYGLALIAAQLQNNGFSVEIIDALATSKSKNLAWPEEMNYLHPYYGKHDITPFSLFHRFKHFGYGFSSTAEKARRFDPWLVGIASLFTPYQEYAERTADAVRKACPGAVIVIGGHHPTAFPESVLSWTAVDFIIRGDGEQATPLLAHRILENGPYGDIPGIGFRKGGHGLHINPPAEIKSLDSIAPSAPDSAVAKYYSRNKRKSIVIAASRGCPMRCAYCCMGGSRPTYRIRPVDHVFEEIESSMSNYDVGFIDFEDEHLTLNKSWFMDLMSRFISRYGKRNIELRAMNGLFPPSLDSGCIRKMREAGFKTLNLSVGSLDKGQLLKFNRPDMMEPVMTAIDTAKRENLDVVAYLIAGAPGQSAENSLRDIIRLAQQDVLVGVSIFYPAPGSRYYSMCEELGILPDSMALFRSSAIPMSHADARTDAVTLLRIGRIVNFMKSLKDRNLNTPGNAGEAETTSPQNLNGRMSAGLQALQYLFTEGKIMGYDPDAGFYEHTVSRPLVELFLNSFEMDDSRNGFSSLAVSGLNSYPDFRNPA